MKKINLNIEKSEYEKLSQEIFMKISGLICGKAEESDTDVGKGKSADLNLDTAGRKRAIEIALNARDKVFACADVRSTCVFFGKDEFELSGRLLTVNHQTLLCPAFGRISPAAVEGVLIYALTAGDIERKSCAVESAYGRDKVSLVDQIYADLWGTAIVDAARFCMRERLNSIRTDDCQCTLSEDFGPGFYGMNANEMQKIGKLLDFSEAGLEMLDRGTILPQKSCAGICFYVNCRYKPVDSACEDCRGNQISCSLCNISSGNGD